MSVRIHFKIAAVSSSSRAEQTDFQTDALQIIIVGKLFLEILNLNRSTYIRVSISLDLSSPEGTPKRTPAPVHSYIMLQDDIYRSIQA